MRDVINMFKPENIIPCQGTHKHMDGMLELAEELGYKKGRSFHMLNDGKGVILK